ncbi:hypothetical protein ACM41_07440 [Bradyrhizobium sp. CCBAU 21362]|uniref:DUF3102 domain-containing protein n=1 Tax=Bradyrhizobium sp. CCBAU 21362 TaxID=1325082 RepID=UPI0023067333|nr:DUF3102 domain-containing protein [Bradyrhizobium sp. CCBAU 21362]MDA9536105.1 hypothetical protein [Bradyrhizobium sp. CCBAU 21362]
MRKFFAFGAMRSTEAVARCHHFDIVDKFEKALSLLKRGLRREMSSGVLIVTSAEQFNYDQVEPDKAEELRELAGVIRLGVRLLTRTAVEIGRSLTEAKAGLPGRVFLKWCRLEAGFEPRTAQLYMNLAALYERYGEDVYHVPLSAALDLAAPSVHEATCVDILARARRGERLTVEFVKECIRRAKSKAGNPDESVSEGAAAISNMLANEIGIATKMALQKYLGASPGAHDRLFMKSFRERIAKDLRQNSVRVRMPLTHRLPAA